MNEIVFAVAFIVTRGVIIPFALYLTYTGDKVPRMLKVFCSGLTFISFLWIFQILNLLVKRAREAL